MFYRVAIMCCPACGQDVSLSHHTITEDGTISPSVVCPTIGYDGSVKCPCGFHDMIKLMGQMRTADRVKPW